MAKTSTPKPSSTVNNTKEVADASENKKKKQKPFDENPKLPKVNGNPDNYFLKHKPAHQEAQLWLAKTLIERDRFGEAENILRSLEAKDNTYKEIKEEIYPVQAHSALSRGQTEKAVEPLSKAVEITGDRILRARYAYILAQVLERTNRYNDALAAYDQVVKLKPTYEMTFNALLSKLKMQSNTGNVDSEKYADALNKMIKDDKNQEYQDQLYFALAQQELKNGNKAGAIAKLSESIRNSAGNQVQKAESYYTIAQLYFEDDEYVKAKYYFDSTQTVMSKNDLRYDQVVAYSKNLSSIATNLETIQLQDSLIRISQLSDKELKDLAADIKKKAAQAAAAAQVAATQSTKSNLPTLNVATQSAALGQQGGSVFFAYDDRAVKKGQRDFSREWGGIGLQDNWRRSSSAAFGVIASESTGELQQAAPTSISETEIDEIFKDVPRTPEQMDASNKKIEDALFALGQLFRSELSNSIKSVESLDQLLKRYPDTEHAMDAYYLLYVDHTELGNSQEATFYSKKILDEFADSEYAKYINDPSYLQNALTDDEKAEKYYQDVHMMFDQGQYEPALKQLVQAKNNLPAKHNLLSKFSFLTAMCIGKLQGREPYVNALKETIAKYPNTKEEERAKEIIRLLGIRFTETTEGIEEINPEAYFNLTEDDKMHMVLVVLKTEANGQERNVKRSCPITMGCKKIKKSFWETRLSTKSLLPARPIIARLSN
ncbi:MAG: tetratricopeptide repeat protein [Saprospiraceae bacterium]|nr:tetratricopeptide repeat protein [Saprospiraceae bacterium]